MIRFTLSALHTWRAPFMLAIGFIAAGWVAGGARAQQALGEVSQAPARRSSATPSPTPASTGSAESGAAFEAMLEAAAGPFAGVSAGVGRGGTISWASSAGLCDREAQKPCTPQTLMRIASITKPMTAVAVLQLHERGLLDLDAPLSTLLPDYPADAARAMTTRQLLWHTAGVDGYGSTKERETVETFATLADAARVFWDRKLLFEPGTAYQYTTYGYVVLGLVIEAVSGQSYGAYLREHVWEPAGMQSTGVEEFGQTYENKSALYTRTKKGRIKKGAPNNLSNRIPGGGVYSTVEDMLRFGMAVLDGTLVSADALELMLTAPEVERGDNNPYGMGWFIYQRGTGSDTIFGHSGQQTGASGQLMLVPEKNLVVIVLSNTSHAWQTAIELSVELIQAALASESRTSPRAG